MIVSEISFWYGLSFRDIAQTPIKMLFVYLNNLEAHKAEKSVLMAEVEALPHSKTSATQRTVNGWKRSIRNTFGGMGGKKATKSPVVHRAMLAARGISVQLQKPKENKTE